MTNLVPASCQSVPVACFDAPGGDRVPATLFHISLLRGFHTMTVTKANLQPAASPANATHLAVGIMQYINSREAERVALAQNPMIPRENLRAILHQFNAQTSDQLRPHLERIGGMIGELRAANVKTRFDYRPTTPTAATLHAATITAASNYSDAVLVRRTQDARADGNVGLVQDLADEIESRLPTATGESATLLNHALYDAREALASTPEAQASAQWETWCDDAARDLRALAVIATTENAADRLAVYLTPEVNALPTLIPAVRTGGTVRLGFTEPATV